MMHQKEIISIANPASILPTADIRYVFEDEDLEHVAENMAE